jgi:hypothetical protein
VGKQLPLGAMACLWGFFLELPMIKLAVIAIVATLAASAALFAGGVHSGTNQIASAQSRYDAALAAMK